MRYIPHTRLDIAAMLQEIGVKSIDDLFEPIDSKFRLVKPLNLPPAMPELELLDHLKKLAGQNRSPDAVFIGGGSYRHHVPTAVDALISRAEFYTSYTPYQPEIAQGTLQAIFEFQSLVCRLLSMDVSNAGMYDGASGFAEAVLMAHRIQKRPKILLPAPLNHQYEECARTILNNLDVAFDHLPIMPDGRTDFSAAQMHGKDVAAVVVQQPNSLGVIEDINHAREAANAVGGLLIVTFAEPLAFGLILPPGHAGADIAVGEGGSFGCQISFGGPTFGMFACRKDFIRSMPGRLVGETTDAHGRRGYVLTLATREQHIRREKATSNICTNQALCSTSAAIHMSLLGKNGLFKLASLNYERAEHLKKHILCADVKLPFAAHTFNEFVFETGFPAIDVLAAMAKRGYLAGLPLPEKFNPDGNRILAAVTEMNSPQQIEGYAVALTEVLGELR